MLLFQKEWGGMLIQKGPGMGWLSFQRASLRVLAFVVLFFFSFFLLLLVFFFLGLRVVLGGSVAVRGGNL